MDQGNVQQVKPTYWMPTKPGEQPRPAPSIMCEQDAISFMGIGHVPNAHKTLGHWRRKGILRGSYVSKGNWSYSIEDVIKFLEYLANNAQAKAKIGPKKQKRRERRTA